MQRIAPMVGKLETTITYFNVIAQTTSTLYRIAIGLAAGYTCFRGSIRPADPSGDLGAFIFGSGMGMVAGLWAPIVAVPMGVATGKWAATKITGENLDWPEVAKIIRFRNSCGFISSLTNIFSKLLT